MFNFNSQMNLGEDVVCPNDELVIKNEPMLFSCDREAAQNLGGPLTKAFCEALNKVWKNDNYIVDSRVHMLMPGWFPCIPGYHHDDIPRSRSDGQPNYENPEYVAEHAMMLIGGDVCPTEFAVGQCSMQEVPMGEIIYKQWHLEVEECLKNGTLTRVNAPSNQLVFFDSESFHTGTRAVKNGWRFFIRATRYSHRIPTNELRRQVQVYLENPMEGW